MSSKKSFSVAAVIITGLYLAAVITAFVLMLLTRAETAPSGVFLVFVTMPWATVLGRAIDAGYVDSELSRALFLVAGGFVNALVLYHLVSVAASFMARLGSGKRTGESD